MRCKLACFVFLLVSSQPGVVLAESHIPSLDDATAARVKIGAAIYAESCLHCHGMMGRGVEDAYPDSLAGDASVGELVAIIAETMPEEDPDACVAKDAEAVALYVYHTFYSEAARLRNRPPRVVLQRLTANQLRQSLSDVFAYRGQVANTSWQAEQELRGLEGTYYTTQKWKKEDRKIERVDAVVDFDWGTDGPDGKPAGEGDVINGQDFHAHFEGGLRAPRTGLYEIVVRCTTSFKMYLGHHDHELIDNHVQSEGREEFRRRVRLTGGRVYRVQIDLYQRKRKNDKPPSRIQLAWIPPGGVEEIIPSQYLHPEWSPSVLLLESELPPDDRTYGYERGIAVDSAWDNAVTDVAFEFADHCFDSLWPDYLRSRKKDKADRRTQLRDFLGEIVGTAHRGTLDQVTRERVIEESMAAGEDESWIIRRAVLLAIKSPRFLYPALDSDRPASLRAANRLALVMHDSVPAKWLLDAARDRDLTKPQARREAAWRLLDDARTRAKFRDMMDEWLHLREADSLIKDKAIFAGFDASVVSALRRSLDRFIDETVWSEASDFRQLVAADWTYSCSKLARYFGDSWQPADASAAAVDGFFCSHHDPQVHCGVLTHPLVMATLSYHDSTSPIHRGVFLIRQVMGRTLRPPNAAFSPLSQDLHPDLTTRQRVELQTGAEGCQICHQKINSLGFALENFDATGRFRERDNGKKVDAKGSYVTREDVCVPFNGGRELAAMVSTSADAHRGFVNRMFQHFVKQAPGAYGSETLDRLTDRFQQSQFHIQELLIEIAVIASEPNPSGDAT
ncbi:MAG: DUF1588 domain-containing protein [Planctomycetota bacterium]